MSYIYMAVGLAFAGLLGFATWEKSRAEHYMEAAAASAALVKQWHDASLLAQKERDSARTELNVTNVESKKAYDKLKKEKDNAYQALVDSIKSTGHSGLFVPLCAGNVGSAENRANSNPPGTSGSAGAELPVEIALDLIALGHEADAIVGKLTAAQSLLQGCYKAAEQS